MAVHRQHEEGPSSSSSMSISTIEPTPTMDCSRNTIHSKIDVDENTENIPTTLDRFPKYIDCQETLVEMSFVKWLAGFRLECRMISCRTNTELYFGLLNFFCQNIVPEIEDCRNKINKSTLLKSYLEQSLMFFRGYYKTVKKDKGDTLDVIYYDRMSSLLAYYIDLNLMSSQRYKENSYYKKTSSKINTVLFVFLDQKLDYMFDSVFQLYYVFHNPINLGSIMLPVFIKLLSKHPMPKQINYLTYMRYILCFKLWKKIIHSSQSMADSVKKLELENLKSLLSGLNVPNDFMSQHKKYNWRNWPKLTMSPNGTPDTIQRDLKNVSLVLYYANLSLEDCYKDILDVSRKDIPILLKPFQEQCKMLRPDLFAISGKEVLRNWNENFDNTLKPLITTTRSCNSLMKKIKYNFFTPCKYECPEIDDENNKASIVPINLSKLIKRNENEKSSVDALKQLTHESLPANVKRQSNEDEMQVNVKKSKSSEKHLLNRDDGRFYPTISNKPSRLNYISETTSTSHHPECSYSKGSKRNQCPSFDEKSNNKKICRTKSEHEKNVSNCNPNQIVDSNCHNSMIEYSSLVTVNNDNSVLENPKNSQNINGVSCLMNESSVKENKWVEKASHSKLSITTALNLKHTQSNLTVSDNDESIDNCTKIIDLSGNQDFIASPFSDAQWPVKLSHSDAYYPEPKPIIDNSEQMEFKQVISFDTEANNTPNTENVLSLRNSEEMISTFVSSRSINEIENTQMYDLPMDQKLSLIDHPYVETAINSNTRVNVLSPVSINSTDIPKNKSSLVQVLSSVHNLNDYNDIDCDHSQSSLQQLNGLMVNSININTSCVTNQNSEVDILNNIQLETPTMPRHTNYHQKQKLKLYTDPTEMISVPNNLSTQSTIPINLNEAHVQKRCLGNKSSTQVYYSPIPNFRVSSELEMTNHGNIEDLSLTRSNNRQINSVNMCSNDKNIYHMLQPTDNDPNVKQTLMNGYDGFFNQNLSIMNNRFVYQQYPRSDSNTFNRYENLPFGLQHKNSDHILPHNGLQYSSYDHILGPSLWFGIDGFEAAQNYVEGKLPSIEEGNCENDKPTNTQILLNWKKHLAQRFTSKVKVESQLNNDVGINSQNVQNARESYYDADDRNKSLNSECKKELDIGPKCLIENLHLYSYQVPKLDQQNSLATSHQCDEEHFPSEINRSFLNNSLSPSFQSMNLNLTSQSLQHLYKNISNTTHQASAENSPSTSHESSIRNLTNSSHEPILSNFPSTSHGISLDSCSTLNDRGLKHHMSRQYSDGQMYTEFPHTYLQDSISHIPNSSTNSYDGSPVIMPADNSMPFCSPSLSNTSVLHSSSSDCSVPSLVETVNTAVLEHTLDDYLELINAAHNLMMISYRHRYNRTTSITTTKTTHTMTVSSTTTTNYETKKF